MTDSKIAIKQTPNPHNKHEDPKACLPGHTYGHAMGLTCCNRPPDASELLFGLNL